MEGALTSIWRSISRVLSMAAIVSTLWVVVVEVVVRVVVTVVIIIIVATVAAATVVLVLRYKCIHSCDSVSTVGVDTSSGDRLTYGSARRAHGGHRQN
jgi:hypothetical protein